MQHDLPNVTDNAVPILPAVVIKIYHRAEAIRAGLLFHFAPLFLIPARKKGPDLRNDVPDSP